MLIVEQVGMPSGVTLSHGCTERLAGDEILAAASPVN